MLDQSPSSSYKDKRHALKCCKIINLIKRLNRERNDNTLIIFKGVHPKKQQFVSLKYFCEIIVAFLELITSQHPLLVRNL